MEDKDFDQLFKDQFEEAEVAPSTNLWDNIEKELSPKKRVMLPAYWMAAAVVVIGVMVAVLMPKTEPIRLQGNRDVAAATVAPEVISSAVVADRLATVVEDKEEKSTPLVIAARLNEEDVKKDFELVQPNVARKHPVNMDVQTSPSIIAKVEPESPVNDVMIARVESTPEVQANTIAEQPEHKGIRNVGDLINIVVNKVDKRDKKLIQFNTDEDDNSSVVAINIGFLKFNKRDKNN
ncbi:MAG: hypothetical protein EOO85_01000 [Pedobacter sp.]|nr:MAG: hypothetical protein EOO85_01000 [Pedobacter sp.]